MLQLNISAAELAARAAPLLCALVTNVAMSAPPHLQSIAVAPSASTISVGQKQHFTATGTFSNGSRHILGEDIRDISAGNDETCLLLTHGGVQCWGANGFGQLGDGTTVDSLVPRPVKWITNATAVATGYWHACALLAPGTVQCWGFNGYGQLGNGTRTGSTLPVRVNGIDSATAIATGQQSTCALLESGEVRCWGFDPFGGSWDPALIPGINSGTAITAGADFNCALLGSGAVQCWGRNVYGQLGDGTTTNSAAPVTVRGLSNVTAIAAGWFYTCALLAAGTVECWGHGGNGERGDGTTSDSSVPVPVTGISNAVAVMAGAFHACALLRDGSVRCWGANISGQVGSGSTTYLEVYTPVRVSEISAPVKLTGGRSHTCALLVDGAMRCWGENNLGQLGNRRTTSLPTRWPVNVIGTPGVVWQSSHPSIATIPHGRLATGRASGNTTITATTAGGLNDNAVLTVK